MGHAQPAHCLTPSAAGSDDSSHPKTNPPPPSAPFRQFEADRRVINITINSLNTELTKEDRYKLFPTNGRLFPDGTSKMARCDDIDQVRIATECCAVGEGCKGAAGRQAASSHCTHPPWGT